MKWRVEFKSGRHVTIRAANEDTARIQAQAMWPSDPVVDVRRWGL